MGPKDLFDIVTAVYDKIDDILKTRELNDAVTKKLEEAQRLFKLRRFKMGIDMCLSVGTDWQGNSYNIGQNIIGLGYFGLAHDAKGSDKAKITEYLNEAIRSFEAAYQWSPSYADPRFYKGLVLAELGQYEDAIESYEDVIALESNYVGEAWYNKGKALTALGRTAEANAAFAKATDLRYKPIPDS